MGRKTDRRIELHELLCSALGSRNVYFQPPESLKLKYPAIVYGLNNVRTLAANNKTNYKLDTSYKVTLIEHDPDSEIMLELLTIPKCKFDSHYVADNLIHNVFTIYY